MSTVIEPQKSSAEILTELFSSFNAEPPNLQDTSTKKHKKSKKKHKHKLKKHKKKSKYKCSSSDSSDDSSDQGSSHKRKLKKRNKEYEYLKQLTELNIQSIKREPVETDKVSNKVVLNISDLDRLIKQEQGENKKTFVKAKSINTYLENNDKDVYINIDENKVVCEKHSKDDSVQKGEVKESNKITIKNLKNSSVYEATIKEVEEKAARFEEGELTGTENENDDLLDNLTPETPPRHHDDKYGRKQKHGYSDKNKIIEYEESKRLKRDKQKSGSRDREYRTRRDGHHSHSHSHSNKDPLDRDKYKFKECDKINSQSGDRSRSRDRDKLKSKSRADSRSKEQDKKRSRSRSKDRGRRRSKSRDKSKSRDRDKRLARSKDRSRSRDRGKRRSKSTDRIKSRDYLKRRSKSRERDKRNSRSSRDRSSHRLDRKRRSKSPTSLIDKKKLLEIARKNAISMLKSGTLPEALTLGPQAQEKVIAAIKSGGKTIEELTDFCRNLSKKEALGELSSVSSNEEDVDSNGESGKPFHHPFQLKEKPLSIIMNIKNSTPLPLKSAKEKSAELRLQFPVSSGQQHRKTENEWVPVSPKATETALVPLAPAPVPAPVLLLPPAPPPMPLPLPPPPILKAIEPPPPPFDVPAALSSASDVDISSIVSQRLSAMRRLQENPHDAYAMTQISESSKQMQSWAQSKLQPGQFTGSTGVQILSPAELSSGYQAWAKKDQLQTAAPVTGGMGMHLLQKMGWKPGEGLGKEKTGSLEPLLLEVKLDKKGLVANEEVKGKRPNKVPKTGTVKTLSGKHPVSLLGEFATKRKLGVPQYDLCFECGPDHKKNFLFKVTLNGIEYKANVASSTKKQAKADAATVCLQQLGLLL